MCWSCKRKGEGEREKWVSVSGQNQTKLRVLVGGCFANSDLVEEEEQLKTFGVARVLRVSGICFVWSKRRASVVVVLSHTRVAYCKGGKLQERGFLFSCVFCFSLFQESWKREVNERYGVACLSGWIWETCHKDEHSQVCYLVFFFLFFSFFRCSSVNNAFAFLVDFLLFTSFLVDFAIFFLENLVIICLFYSAFLS